MSDSSGDGGEVLVALAFLLTIGVLIGAIWLAFKAIEYCIEHRDEIAEFLLTLAKWTLLALWSPFVAVTWVTLALCRDLVVIEWPSHCGEKDEQGMVVLWIVGLPIFLSAAWFVSASLLFSQLAHQLVFGAFVGTVCTVIGIITYYYMYFQRPPKHHNWPIFIACEERMLASARLAYIQGKARLRLWWKRLRRVNQSSSGGSELHG